MLVFIPHFLIIVVELYGHRTANMSLTVIVVKKGMLSVKTFAMKNRVIAVKIYWTNGLARLLR